MLADTYIVSLKSCPCRRWPQTFSLLHRAFDSFQTRSSWSLKQSSSKWRKSLANENSRSSNLIVFLMMSRFDALWRMPQMSMPAKGIRMIGEPSLSNPVVPCGIKSLKTAGDSHDSMSSTPHLSRHFSDCKEKIQWKLKFTNLNSVFLPRATFSQHSRDSIDAREASAIKSDRRVQVSKYLTLTDGTEMTEKKIMKMWRLKQNLTRKKLIFFRLAMTFFLSHIIYNFWNNVVYSVFLGLGSQKVSLTKAVKRAGSSFKRQQ